MWEGATDITDNTCLLSVLSVTALLIFGEGKSVSFGMISQSIWSAWIETAEARTDNTDVSCVLSVLSVPTPTLAAEFVVYLDSHLLMSCSESSD